MTDVTEAAERLRRFNRELMQGTVVESGRVDYEGVEAARITLADAYLAEHPATDAMLVLRPYLKQFEYLDGDDTYADFLVSKTANGCITIRWFAKTEHCEESISMYYRGKLTHTNPTEGDVRLLAKALGLKLEDAE